MSKSSHELAVEKMNAVLYLRKVCKPGKRLYMVVRKVSSSGMSRTIQVLISRHDKIEDISWAVARVLDIKFDTKHGGVKISGCGMDMSFYVCNRLSLALHGGKDVGGGDSHTPSRWEYKAGYSLVREVL